MSEGIDMTGRARRRITIKAIATGGLVLLLSLCRSYGQTAEKTITFDAASIKPAVMPAPGRAMMAGPTGGPGTQDPGSDPKSELGLYARVAYRSQSRRNVVGSGDRKWVVFDVLLNRMLKIQHESRLQAASPEGKVLCLNCGT
jgi:hypothetical protein